MPVAPGEIVMEKYRVERLLGLGAMGVVVSARHVTLDRIVAIKLLVADRFGSRAEASARFLTEARAAARIDSDHVCRVFDVGQTASGVPFMVMEHLDGNDLDEELQRRAELHVHEAVDYVLQAIDAIAAAHALGIVHRDLKPANLFLAIRADGSRRVKVLDFGISKERGVEETSVRAKSVAGSFGTPAYMSPEQVRGDPDVDGRADVWALGAILYELLTGQMAFTGKTVKDILDMVLADDPCPIRQLRRDVPPELEAVVARCLARSPEDRWPTAGALAHALAPFASAARHVSPSLRDPSAYSLRPVVASMSPSSNATLPDVDEARQRVVAAHARRLAYRRWGRAAGIALGVVGFFATSGVVAVGVSARVTKKPAAVVGAVAPPSAMSLPTARATVTASGRASPAPSTRSSSRVKPKPPRVVAPPRSLASPSRATRAK